MKNKFWILILVPLGLSYCNTKNLIENKYPNDFRTSIFMSSENKLGTDILYINNNNSFILSSKFPFRTQYYVGDCTFSDDKFLLLNFKYFNELYFERDSIFCYQSDSFQLKTRIYKKEVLISDSLLYFDLYKKDTLGLGDLLKFLNKQIEIANDSCGRN